MADSQDIEAKLAAYVDGELPPDQRAEIEKYLSANPQQRRLIADLMRQRDVLRDLPKVSAPTDVAETLNAQLERSVLLDGGDRDGVAGTINPWRSIAAVAAVVLLVSALGLTIYSLLPSPSRTPRDLASMQTVPATRPGSESIVENEATPASVPAASEQEMRARSAFAQNEAKPSAEPMALAPTPRPLPQASVIGGGAVAETASAEKEMALAAKPELAMNGPTTEPSIVPPIVRSDFVLMRVETIDIASADAASTRRQLASTLTALGGKLQPPATAPADPTEDLDSTLAVAVPPQDMDRAIAVARSFSTILPAAPTMAKSIGVEPATHPAMESNANASQMQNMQPLQQQAVEQDMLAIPATQPTQLVTVRLTELLPEPTLPTPPTTNPTTEPTSFPATEPTTQP